MFKGKNRGGHRALLAIGAVVAAATTVGAASAELLYWQPGSSGPGGTGIWDTATPNWSNVAASSLTYANSLSTEAIFTGSAGTVTLNSTATDPLLAGIWRQSGSVYNYTGGDIQTSDIQLAADAVATIESNLVGNTDLIVEQTDGSALNDATFANNTLSLNSLTISNSATIPANQVGLNVGFVNATVNFAAAPGAGSLAFQLGDKASASIQGGTQFNFSNALAYDYGTLSLAGAGTVWRGGSNLELQGNGTLNVGTGAQITDMANLGTMTGAGAINVNGGAAVNISGDLYLSGQSGNISNLTESDEGTAIHTNRLDLGGTGALGAGGLASATIEFGAAANVSGMTELWGGGDSLVIDNAQLTTADLTGAAGSVMSLADPSSGSALTVNGNSGETNYFYGLIRNYTNSAGTQTRGGITKDGNSNLVFAADNTYSGPTIINGGTISVDNTDALQNTPVTLNINDGINFNGFGIAAIGGLNGAGNLNIGATNLIIDGPFTQTYSGNLSSTVGGITFAGIGGASLTGASNVLNYLTVGVSGGLPAVVNIDGGAMTLTNTNGTSLSVTTGTLTVENGAQLTLPDTTEVDHGTLTISGSGTTWKGGAALDVGGTGVLNIQDNASVTDLGSLLADGSGTAININGGATASLGNVYLNNGTAQSSILTISDPGTKVTATALGIGGESATQNGGVSAAFIENGAVATVNGLTQLWNTGDVLTIRNSALTTQGLGGTAGTILFLADPANGSALTINGNSGITYDFNGLIADYTKSANTTIPGGIAKDGNSNFVLNSANTFSGPTIINGGTISIGNADALQFTAVTLNVVNGINFNGQTTTALAGLNGPDNQTVGDTNVVISPLLASSYAGDFSAGTGGITVYGLAAQTFTGGSGNHQSMLAYLAVGGGGGSSGTGTVNLTGGTMLLTDTGSTGFSGTSSLFVDTGGQVNISGGAVLATDGTPQVNNNGSITVTGANSSWTNSFGNKVSDIRIGYAGGLATVDVAQGGLIHSLGNMDIGGVADTSNAGFGQVNVDAGGTLHVDNALNMYALSYLMVNQGQATVGAIYAKVVGGFIGLTDPNSTTPALTIAPQTQTQDTFNEQINNGPTGPGSILYLPVPGSSLTLNGVNSYTGNTTINGVGTLELQTQTNSSNFYALGGGTLLLAGTPNSADTGLVPLTVTLSPTGQMLTDAQGYINFDSVTVTGGTFYGNSVVVAQQDLPDTNIAGPLPQNTFNNTVFEPGSSITVNAPAQFNNLTSAGGMVINYTSVFQNVTNATTGSIDFNRGNSTLSNFINDGALFIGQSQALTVSHYFYSPSGSSIAVGAGSQLVIQSPGGLQLGGDLKINGLITGNVSAASGAQVTGIGLLNGSLLLGTGAELAPTPIPSQNGVLAINNLTLGNASILNFTLGGATGEGNTFIVSGDLTLGNDVVVQIAGTSGFGPGTYQLLTYTNSLTNAADLSTWQINGPSGFNFRVGDPSGTVNLYVTTPEPAALAMLACGGLALLVRRKRA